MSSPFTHEPPASTSPSTSLSPFAPLFESHFSSTSPSTLSILSTLSQSLYRLQVTEQVAKELEQLRGELRDEYRPRLKAVKADYMARIVWNDTHDGDDDDDKGSGFREGQPELEESVGGEEAEKGDFKHPTFLSDQDSQDEMSKRVDRVVEEEIEKSLGQAFERIEKGVESTKKMEFEIWLSETVSTSLSLSLSLFHSVELIVHVLRADTRCL